VQQPSSRTAGTSAASSRRRHGNQTAAAAASASAAAAARSKSVASVFDERQFGVRRTSRVAVRQTQHGAVTTINLRINYDFVHS